MRLREFIAENNPGAARRISQRLLTSVKHLVDQPDMGVPIEELRGTRDLIVCDYIIRYIALEEEIHILRIWHGREDR